jgi:hypothetical protein
MLTDPGDLVVDPFAGSCVTGEVAERLDRKWLCVEVVEDYLRGALGRFAKPRSPKQTTLLPVPDKREPEYKLANPAALWNGADGPPLPGDGGRTKPKARATRRTTPPATLLDLSPQRSF